MESPNDVIVSNWAISIPSRAITVTFRLILVGMV